MNELPLHETRKSRGRISDFVRPAGVATPHPEPPFRLRDSTKLYMCATIDPDRVRPLLPAGLRLHPSNNAIMSVYTCGDTPYGPYAGSIHGVVVEGYDSPDGMECVYWTGGFNDAVGVGYLQHYYSADWMEGTGRIVMDGDRIIGESCGPDGKSRLRFVMRTTDEPGVMPNGAYHYMGREPETGATRIFSVVGYARHAYPGVLESVEIADDAPEGIRALRPVGLNWSVYLNEISMVFGAPRVLGTPGDQLVTEDAGGLLLALFDNHKRAGAIVGEDGRVRFVNLAAMSLLQGDAVVGVRLGVGTRAEQASLMAAIAGVAGGDTAPEPVPLSIGDTIIVAQASALDARIAGRGGVLVTFTDPGAQPDDESRTVLQLLGLTPAEARLASTVGGGASPREAAETLGISESTARSTMKVVFDKLRIGRQSELARIVARLELL